MKKPPKTRVTKAEELEARIEKLASSKSALFREADELDLEAEKLLKIYCANRGGWDNNTIHRAGIDAKSLLSKARGLRNRAGSRKRLDYLKDKLAELRTGTLPGIMQDSSVSV